MVKIPIMKHLRKAKQIINHFVRKPLKVTSYNKEHSGPLKQEIYQLLD